MRKRMEGGKEVRLAWVIPNAKPEAAAQPKAAPRVPKAPRPAPAKREPLTLAPSASAPSMSTTAPPTTALLSRAEMGALLRRLAGRHAGSLYDKYQLLEERDKILRKGRARRGDVAAAVAVTGTCADMCPEKERYIREVQNRMSVYETDEGGAVDASKCVKDYSRSSADQEEPLPHELRPAPILRRTLAYLYGRIPLPGPGEDDAKLAAWYDFLWNRTRAIRKVSLSLLV